MDNSFFKDIFSFKDIAVVGLSPNPARPSNYVSKYMRENGYNIIPVNPGHKSIFDIECYPSLNRIPHSIEIVNVFRNSKYVLPIIKEALFIKSKVPSYTSSKFMSSINTKDPTFKKLSAISKFLN